MKFAGGIFEQLSKNIPSTEAAILELIKNSYDAGATNVVLSLDTHRHVLIVRDDGRGFKRENIENLFHVGKSNKLYGARFEAVDSEKRFCQGAKGLGFISVMKFGKHIKWMTSTGDDAFEFECDTQSIIGESTLNDYTISCKVLPLSKHGTSIIIDINDDEYDYLSSNIWGNTGAVQKLTNAFLGTNFNIVFTTDGKQSCERIPRILNFDKVFPARQFLFVKFDSSEKRVCFYNRGKLIQIIDFPIGMPDECKICGELAVFRLQGASKNDFDGLYKNGRGALAPIVYINSCIFDDDTLFDPDIMRGTKSSMVLPQMIGYINIESQRLEFNVDRTKIVDDSYSRPLKKCIKELNMKIQKTGAALKKDFQNLTGPAQPRGAFGNSTGRIMLRQYRLTLAENDAPVRLREYVLPSYKADGSLIDVESIQIRCNNLDVDEIDYSILPDNSKVIYTCPDADVLPAVLEVQHARDKHPVKSKSIPILIDFNETTLRNNFIPMFKEVDRLARAVNSLRTSERMERLRFPVIACCMRPFFEIPCIAIRKNIKRLLPDLAATGKKEIESIISGVFDLISKDNKFKEHLVKNTTINFDSLKNLSADSFILHYRASHLGAHRASTNLRLAIVEDMARDAACFVVLAHELYQYRGRV